MNNWFSKEFQIDKEYVHNLRQEGIELKECFTRYTFQCLVFSAALLSVLFRYVSEYDLIGLAGLLNILVILYVIRIGNHKYASANRIFGYELNLYRTRKMADSDLPGGWRKSMNDIGWEEAIKAWRVIVSHIYPAIYRTSGFRKNQLLAAFENQKDLWFSIDSKMKNQSVNKFYVGDFLSNMFRLLYGVIVLSVVPVLITGQVRIGNIWKELHLPNPNVLKVAGDLLILLIIVIALGRFAYKIMHHHNRKKIVEDGMFSIHACAILWQAVLAAHHRALQKIADGKKNYLENNNLYGYIAALSEEGLSLARSANLLGIHKWTLGSIPEPTNGRQT